MRFPLHLQVRGRQRAAGDELPGRLPQPRREGARKDLRRTQVDSLVTSTNYLAFLLPPYLYFVLT